MSERRWNVVYTLRSMYEGDEEGDERPRALGVSSHRTFIGADFHRRFHSDAYPTLGNRWVETSIIRTGADPLDPDPRMASVVMPFWSVLYWLRKRWDGLRFGLDRDRRSF